MPHIEGNPTKPAPDLGLRGLALLDFIIEQVEAHPETFDMKTWATVANFPGLTWKWSLGDEVPATCGSAMCVAGWAAHLAGAELLYAPQYDPKAIDDTLVLVADYVRVPDHITIPDEFSGGPPLTKTSVSNFAAKMLEMPATAAGEMFDSDNTLDEIKRLRRRYIAQGVWSVGAQTEA